MKIMKFYIQKTKNNTKTANIETEKLLNIVNKLMVNYIKTILVWKSTTNCINSS